MVFQQIILRMAFGSTKQLILALVYFIAGGSIMLLVLAVLYLNNGSELKVWHSANLDEEFTVNTAVNSFSEYRALEKRLFKQLDERVYAKISAHDKTKINRFHSGSLTDPNQWQTNWNQSFELTVKQPRVGIVLIHGLSDSPYSLRSIGQKLHSDGAWVTGLRVPGHGTAPVGLVNVTWQDMAAAVKLAVKHVREKIGTKPLYIVGYSNGGGLAVQYALTSLQDESLPMVEGLVLVSPEIGVTKLAKYAIWQERLGQLLGLDKMQWNSILPEYDSFKYNSFAINAGRQAYELTQQIQLQITQLNTSGDLARMPSILAFQSIVDDTVTAQALLDGLFQRLPAAKHELVVFDINRSSNIEPLLISNPTNWSDRLLHTVQQSYETTLITNVSSDSRQVVARLYAPHHKTITDCLLSEEWPINLYSLSHVALPFSANDPLYGANNSSLNTSSNTFLAIGNIALRGERGILKIAEADLLRLRWNPFYNYLEQRIEAFIGVSKITTNGSGDNSKCERHQTELEEG